ncbi:MAG TPA: MFS transporter [Acidimicrobiales bacterium]|nr:MFS transporter [Acidimicrobiales bacterium]
MSETVIDGPDAVQPRFFVPSEREVDEGVAEYRFEPLPPPPPSARAGIKARFRDFIDGLNLRKAVAGQPASPLVFLTVDAILTGWNAYSFIVLLPSIRDELHVDVRYVIGLTTLVAMVGTLIGPVTGFIADRRSRVRMLAIGNVAANAAFGLTGAAPNVGAITAAQVGGGVGQGISQPTVVPLISDWYPPEVRGRVVAFVFAAGQVVGLFGPLVAGGMVVLAGWRGAAMTFGVLGLAASIPFFFVREPKRGRFDRIAMGASEEVAEKEQKAVSWAEGWRAARQVVTLRRIWYATPFMLAGFYISQGIAALYFSDEFGVGPLGRGAIQSVSLLGGIIGLLVTGPLADRMIQDKPGRVFTLLSGLLLGNALCVVVLALSPYLWLSIVANFTLLCVGISILPLEMTMVSLVVPARLRAFGISSIGPWQLLGQAFVQILIFTVPFGSLRGALALLVPIYLAAIYLLGAAGQGVERDIRAAKAASMADEEADRARKSGRNKMIICRDVDVTYDGTQVLFNVDFDVEEGEIVALLGTNGAGKSTLLRAIAGIQEASNGAIFLDGEDITHRPPYQNAAGGIVFMPGGRAVFPSLTVAENLRAAAWMYRQDDEYVKAQTEKVLGYFPILRQRLHQEAGSMSGGEQQMVALGQAFLMKPRLLMIDELSLGLAPAVVEQLLDIVRQVNEEGATIILVEQSVNVALTVARRSVFMDKGEIRFDGSTAELLGRGDLLRSVFLGGAGGGSSGGPFIASGSGLMKSPTAQQEPEQVLLAEHIHVSYGGHKALTDAHVEVAGGDVVGIIGPNGAGKTTLFDVISGYTKPDEGAVHIGGVDVTGFGPDARARLGLSRSFQNARLFPALTVRENIALALEQRLTSRSILAAAFWLPKQRKSERRAFRRVDYLIDLLNLGAFADKFVTELSTGSRRMVDMACVMASEPKALLLDEPSSGVAQSEVEVLAPVVRRLARETGCGVLVIEHDIPLITALSDRLIAMELGAVVTEGNPRDVVDDPRVVQAYLGASETTINRSGSFAAALIAAGLPVGADQRKKTR